MSATIGQITNSVTSLKTLVEEVSEATRQQANGLDQVRQSVVQMEHVTQTTAATAEESAAASEELNSLAATATHMVNELETLIGGAPLARRLDWRRTPRCPRAALRRSTTAGASLRRSA